MKKIPIWLYALTLGATLALFFGAWLVSNYLNYRKTISLQNEEDAVATQILSLQAQSELTAAQVLRSGANASATSTAAVIASNMNDLQAKLAFMQDQLGPENPDLFRLERYFSLLEIKAYLLERALNPAPKTATPISATSSPLFVLYFYPDASCDQCLAQEYILGAVKQQNPQAYVYSFDYTNDFAAVQSLLSLPKIPVTTTPPFFIINNKVHGTFSTLGDFQAAVAMK